MTDSPVLHIPTITTDRLTDAPPVDESEGYASNVTSSRRVGQLVMNSSMSSMLVLALLALVGCHAPTTNGPATPTPTAPDRDEATDPVQGRLSAELQFRIMNVREEAIRQQNGQAVEVLLRLAESFRLEGDRVAETTVSSEVGRVERELGVDTTEISEPQSGAQPRAFLPQSIWRDINYTGDPSISDPLRTLDIYAPEGVQNAPVLVWIHGGGLTGGDKAHPGLTLIKPDFFLSQGIVYVSVNYRLVPDIMYPDFMTDSARAVAWVHDNIADYGGDPGRISLAGHSAGAHISSLLVTNQSFLEAEGKSVDIVNSVLSLDIASYDFATYVMGLGEARLSTPYVLAYGDNEENWIAGSPSRQIEPGEPLPAFLLLYAGDHHEAERMRTANQAFKAQLDELGVPNVIYEAEDRTHTSLNLQIGFRGDPASEVILEFLRAQGMTQMPVE